MAYPFYSPFTRYRGRLFTTIYSTEKGGYYAEVLGDDHITIHKTHVIISRHGAAYAARQWIDKNAVQNGELW